MRNDLDLELSQLPKLKFTRIPVFWKIISQRRKERQVMNENEIGRIVVDSAIAVHRELGPGLLETVYEEWYYQNCQWASRK